MYTRDGHTEEFALKLLREKGYDPEVSQEQLNTLVTLKSQANQGTLDHASYWDEFLSMRGVPDPVQRRQLTSEIENYSNAVLPIPGVRETLQELKNHGYLLGIITDTMYPLDWKMRRLEKVGVADLLDIIACSTVLGAHKPDPAIYSHALKKASLSPSEAVFVGHLGIELQGAHAAGMVTISIDPALEEKADYRCRSLPEVLTLPILQGISAAPLR